MSQSIHPPQEQIGRPETAEHPDTSRKHAREWYWSRYTYDEYEYPDCGRGIGRVRRFDVHHLDGDPVNNDPDNLLGICLRCHFWRHRNPTLSGLDLLEWAEQFPARDSESIGDYVVYDREQTTEWWPDPQERDR